MHVLQKLRKLASYLLKQAKGGATLKTMRAEVTRVLKDIRSAQRQLQQTEAAWKRTLGTVTSSIP